MKEESSSPGPAPAADLEPEAESFSEVAPEGYADWIFPLSMLLIIILAYLYVRYRRRKMAVEGKQ